MSIDSELFDRLSGWPDVAAIAAQRLYPMTAPKDAPTPYAIWQEISRVPQPRAMDGENHIIQSRMQIDSYGETYGESRGLADAVRQALRDWQPSDGVIRDVAFENGRALRETDPALKTFRVSQDYLVTFID